MSFPVKTKNNYPSIEQLRREGMPSSITPFNSPVPQVGNAVGAYGSRDDWYFDTPASGLTANTYQLIEYISPIVGKCRLISGITFFTSDECSLYVLIIKNLYNYSTNKGISGNNGYNQTYRGYSAGKGKTEIKFDFPIEFKQYDEISLYYSRNSTDGVLVQYHLDEVVLTDDMNYGAEKTALIIGDSIAGITNETKANYNDIWTFGVIRKLREDGIDIRHINKAIGGTYMVEWQYFLDKGFCDGISPDVVVVNLGTNDMNVPANLSATEGVDGTFKIATKSVINHFLSHFKNCKVVVNSITPNSYTGQTVISGGLYDGMKVIEAFRQELSESVTEIDSNRVVFCDTSELWDATDPTYYFGGVITNIHPNNTKAQPLMIAPIYNAIKTVTGW